MGLKDLEKKRFYSGKKYKSHYTTWRNSEEGEVSGFDWEWSYKYEGQKSFWARTKESPEKYKIRCQCEMMTIKFENKEYNKEELIDIYNQITKRENEYRNNEIPEIILSDNLLPHELEEVKKFKNKIEARKWKSRQRSLRRKGKLEQYKIDMLNKLGMIWNPKGVSGSSNKWESDYILFKKHGLCFDIKKWIEEQRILFKANKIPNENLFRLQAINFPFESKRNEKYKLTKNSCWELREKLDEKIRRFEIKEQKKIGIYEEKKSYSLTKKEIEEVRKSNNEINSFYGRKHIYCNSFSINKLSKEEVLKKLSKIDKGFSYGDMRLEEFLDIESERFKKNNKPIPYYVKEFYDDIHEYKLTDEDIYFELSRFNIRELDTEVRKRACHYMLKYAPHRSLKTTKFKEIDFLISIYKKEKNKTELLYLKDLLEKFPLLKELYGEKLLNVILKLK